MRPFLSDYRDAERHAPRVERVLAIGRAFLATSGLAAIYLDPTEPSRFATLMYGLLFAYAVHSMAVLALVRRAGRVQPHVSRLLHGIDLLWATLLTVFSKGPVSPFFLFFMFVLLAAAFRWGFRETLATALVTVTVFLIEVVIGLVNPWSRSWFADVTFDLNSVITRVAYLLMTGFLLGYLADQEKQFRAELAALADAMRQPRLELGLGGSVGAICRLVMGIFRAGAVDVVIEEFETSRTLLWHATTANANGQTRIRREELDRDGRDTWLFDAPARTWQFTPADGRSDHARAIDVARWIARPVTVALPARLTSARRFGSIAVVDFGLPAQWRGRVLIYDAADAGSLETRLNFLETVSDHLTPVLSNVFLLRRLRSRASAQERARVARELHDGAIQALIGIEMEVEALRRAAGRNDAPALVPDIEHIQTLLRQEVIALRELMQELRPIDLDAAQQLPEMLGLLVERFRRETGVSARFDSLSPTATLPLRTAVEVVRIVQEGLVNVRKHSRASHVLVQLARQDDGHWIVSVEDNGRGFEFEGRVSSADAAAALTCPAIIRDRARALGGSVTIDSKPGAGSRVEVTFHE